MIPNTAADLQQNVWKREESRCCNGPVRVQTSTCLKCCGGTFRETVNFWFLRLYLRVSCLWITEIQKLRILLLLGEFMSNKNDVWQQHNASGLLQGDSGDKGRMHFMSWVVESSHPAASCCNESDLRLVTEWKSNAPVDIKNLIRAGASASRFSPSLISASEIRARSTRQTSQTQTRHAEPTNTHTLYKNVCLLPKAIQLEATERKRIKRSFI